MKLWSRGLGKTEINMDLRYYKIVRDEETGGVTIKLEPEDIAGIVQLAMNPPLWGFVAKNLMQIPEFIKNRSEFVLEDADSLEQRVMEVYKKMTSPSTGGKKRGKRRGAKARKDKESEGVRKLELADSKA